MTEFEIELLRRAAPTVGIKLKASKFRMGQLFVLEDPHGVCEGTFYFDPFKFHNQALRMVEQLDLISMQSPSRLERFMRLRAAATAEGREPPDALRHAVIRFAAGVGIKK